MPSVTFTAWAPFSSALLTGRPPLEKDEKGNWPEMQQKIQRGEFPRPRSVKPTTPKALEAVCLKAMAMKPEDRYQSARELKADVEQWLADEPVKAYREPATQRIWRWARQRKEWVVGTAVCSVIGIVTVAVGTVMVAAERQRTSFEKRLRNADNFRANVPSMHALLNQHQKLNDEIRQTLDHATALLSQDTRLDTPELQLLRRDLLQTTLSFWDRALAIDENTIAPLSWRGRQYRLQRCLCLARLREHERAAQEATDLFALARSIESPRGTAYDLARVYALCALATQNDSRLTKSYADLAMGCLQEAAADRYFDDSAMAEHLAADPELANLKSREDFVRLLRDVGAKPR